MSHPISLCMESYGCCSAAGVPLQNDSGAVAAKAAKFLLLLRGVKIPEPWLIWNLITSLTPPAVLIADVNNNERRGGSCAKVSVLGRCLLIKNNIMCPAGEPGWHTDTVSRPWCFYLGTTEDQQIELNRMQQS